MNIKFGEIKRTNGRNFVKNRLEFIVLGFLKGREGEQESLVETKQYRLFNPLNHSLLVVGQHKLLELDLRTIESIEAIARNVNKVEFKEIQENEIQKVIIAEFEEIDEKH